MRTKGLIKRLEEVASEISFPTEPDHNFGHFSRDLRTIIEQNLGFQIAKTLEYAEHEQTFFVTLESTHTAREEVRPNGVGPLCFTAARHVQIFPLNPIESQISRLLAISTEVINASFEATVKVKPV